MADKDFKKNMIRDRGPGPGAYMLPPLVGYPNHGLTKKRYPAYTMAKPLQSKIRTSGGGPYAIERNYTRYGKNGIPAYSMGMHLGSGKAQKNPGPAAYLPDYNLIYQLPPKYSLGQRTQMGRGAPTPAPNAYILPTCIGCKIVDKYAYPCYTMGTAVKGSRGSPGPGPASYDVPQLNAYKHRLPIFSMGAQSKGLRAAVINPGPAAYLLKGLGRGASFYFGIKHSEYTTPLILEEDN